MGGVDLADQKTEYYRNGETSKKWLNMFSICSECNSNEVLFSTTRPADSMCITWEQAAPMQNKHNEVTGSFLSLKKKKQSLLCDTVSEIMFDV